MKIIWQQFLTCKRFTPLTLSRFIVVLLPDVSGPGVLPQHVVDHVLPQQRIHLRRQLLVRTLHWLVVVEGSYRQIVDVDPDGTSPVRSVVFCVLLHVQRRVLGQGSQTIRGVEKVRVGQRVDDNTWKWTRWFIKEMSTKCIDLPNFSLSGDRICNRNGNNET